MVHHGRHYDDLEVQRYSRQWWLQVTRNAFWIVVVTLMIWVYADLEINEPREFTVTLRLTRETDGETTLVSQREWSVTFSAKGTRRDLTRFERWLVENENTLDAAVSDYPVGTHDEPVTQLLSRSPGVIRHNLEVQAISPKQLPFTVEALETRAVPIEFDYINATVRNIRIDPAQVNVTTSTSGWETIAQNTDAPIVRTRQEDLTLVDPDDARPRTVPLVPMVGEVPVLLDQPSVTVTFRVSNQPETKTFDIVVGRKTPPNWDDENVWSTLVLVRREAEPTWQYTITVAGTNRDLQRLKPKSIQAFIVLTDDDKVALDQWIKRDVSVWLPPELNVRLADGAPTIEFKLTPRQP
jgi:hypothetical protein